MTKTALHCFQQMLSTSSQTSTIAQGKLTVLTILQTILKAGVKKTCPILIKLQSMFISLLAAQQNRIISACKSNSGRQEMTQNSHKRAAQPEHRQKLHQWVMFSLTALPITIKSCLSTFIQTTNILQKTMITQRPKRYTKLKAFQLSQQAQRATKKLKKSS